MDRTVTLFIVYGVSNCCLSIFGHCWATQSPGKNVLGGPSKSWNFFVTKRVGILNLISVLTSSVGCQLIVKSCRTAHRVFVWPCVAQMDTSSTVVVQPWNLVVHCKAPVKAEMLADSKFNYQPWKREHTLKCKSTEWNSEYDDLLSIWQTFIWQVNCLFPTDVCCWQISQPVCWW